MQQNAANDRSGSQPAGYRATTVLKLHGATRCALERTLREAKRLNARGDDNSEAIRRLCDEARIIEVLVERASREGGQRLPRGKRAACIEETLEALLGTGDAPLTRKIIRVRHPTGRSYPPDLTFK